MGTSLSGLTPATTFDGLLKVGDNDPLTADLKAISTGDGTDTILSLSNSALSIGGDVGIVGSTSSIGASVLLVQNSNNLELLNLYDNGNVSLGGEGNTTTKANIKLDAFNGLFNVTTAKFANFNGATFAVFSGLSKADALFAFGNDTTTASTRMHINGLGATSATTSLLVQNSAGTDMLKVQDDGTTTLSSLNANGGGILFNNASGSLTYGEVSVNGGSGEMKIGATRTSYFPTFYSSGAEAMRISTSQFVGIGETTPTARLHIKGSGNDNTTTSLLVQNSDGADMLKVTDDRNIETYDATGNVISKNNAGNRRFEINPDNTTLVDFQVNGGGFSNLIRTDSGINSVGIGTTGLANTMAYIKGTGATSATTALLVQNSAGELSLKVNDDGSVFSHGGGARTSSNTGFGEGVLASVTTAGNTTAFGLGSLQSVTTGTANTAYGWRSGYSTTGSNNAFVGQMAGYTNSSGSSNTGLGTRVLYNNATASDNTAVGYLADSAGFSGSVILGRSATATADNQFVVGSSGTNAGTITTEAVTSDATWEVVINGTAYKVLLKAV